MQCHALFTFVRENTILNYNRYVQTCSYHVILLKRHVNEHV